MTNPNAICFITCVNDENLYEICQAHIRALIVPPGMQVEVLPVRGAVSMTAGYNTGMQQSDAKYKVYLHQDVYILNVHIIRDLLTQFHSDDRLGLIGLVGAVKLPPSGSWWGDSRRCGKVMELRSVYRYLNFAEVSEFNRTVEGVDGLFMATQYDLPWREDLFDGWHLYDASQCAEFIRKGLRIAVPNQAEHWVLHACGDDFDESTYIRYRDLFAQKYLIESNRE